MDNELNPEQVQDENRLATDLTPDMPEPSRQQPADRQPEPRAEEPEKRDIPRGSPFDEKRAAIYAKAKAQREPQAPEPEPEPAPVVVQPGAPARAEEPAPTRHKVKVNHQEIELTNEELVAHAQRSIAAGDILARAKSARDEQLEILEELRKAKANQSQPQQPASAQQAAPDHQPDNAELDEIITRIQVGDPKEAKEALQNWGDLIESRILDRIGDLDDRIAVTTQQMSEASERQRQTRDTLEAFAKDNQEFTTSPALQTALAYEAAATMRQHMVDRGLREEVIEGIKRENGFDDVQAIGYAYRTLKDRGIELPGHADILKASADNLRKQFGTTRPANPSPQPHVPPAREERKVNMAPQPRRANAAPASEVQERSREEARREAIRQRRLQYAGRG